MKLIIGSAYQGKLDYALEHYVPNASVHHCADTEPAIDFSKDIINSLQQMVLSQLRNGIDSLEYVDNHVDQLKSKIIICNDISSGVVPIDREMRLWREAVGRVLVFLGKHSDEVIRVFCGIGTKIK
jgi:adenosyl cobinamide kinase/adenosyl cobinamide phosphate guanylyltransferase